jgi:hypothetical protein
MSGSMMGARIRSRPDGTPFGGPPGSPHSYRVPAADELFRDLALGWSRSQSFQVARDMRREDIERTELGRFLSKLAASIEL